MKTISRLSEMRSENSSQFSRQSNICLEYYPLGSAAGNDNVNPLHECLAACSAYHSALMASQESVIDRINDSATSTKPKMQRIIDGRLTDSASASGLVKPTSHITVERNRRKVMNERLSVLRSLMPRSYIKKSDKASVIGGVVNYIHELQQTLRTLECKKKSKASSCLKCPPPSTLPVSPSTSHSSSLYKPGFHQQPAFASPVEFFPSDISSTSSSIVNELVATSKSVVAEVEVKFSGSNLILKTTSRRIPGQAMRIVSALEELELEILDANITTTVDKETTIHSFTVKIGIECQLSAEELAEQIQRTFC